jgi:hypothetical protein
MSRHDAVEARRSVPVNAMSPQASTVSVDEVHTHFAAASTGRSRPQDVVPGAAEAGWSDTRGRLDWIEARTRAEGFDD